MLPPTSSGKITNIKHPKGFKLKLNKKTVYLYSERYSEKEIEELEGYEEGLVKLESGYYYLRDAFLLQTKEKKVAFVEFSRKIRLLYKYLFDFT